MSGKVVVVTGATGGIGKEIARGLIRLGADVVIGARDAQRGEATRAELSRGEGNVSVLPLDVADLSSVRAFAARFTTQHGRLDALVNNAGAWFSDRRQSPDGHELTLATNVLGPHLLTDLLLDPIRSAPSARVVNIVSSIVGDYDPTDLQFARRPYDGYKAYAQSKQALTMLTWGLAGRLAGQGITANTAEPGFVRTDFNANAHGPRAMMINLMARLFADAPEKGADTPLWAVSAPELEGVTGRCLAARKQKPPKFTDAGPIAELERLCHDLVLSGAAEGATPEAAE